MIDQLNTIVYWVLCCGVTIHVCLCACMVLLFVRKLTKQGLLLITLYTIDV